MKATVAEMKRMYPKARKAYAAITGYIPMDVFNAVEKDLRPEMRARGYRVIYRGPRTRPNSSMTRRADANFAVIYHRY